VARTIAVEVPDGNLARLQFLVAKEVVDTVAMLTGGAAQAVLDPDWAVSTAQPEEYNIVLRGQAALYGSALSGQDDALQVIEAGLARYPKSVLLLIEKADILTDRSLSGPDEARWDAAQKAWSLLSDLPEASTLPLQERWYLHYVRARLTPPATGDFAAAMRDAEEANRLAPYVPGINIRLAEVASKAGNGARAIEWVRAGLNPKRSPTDWQRETLAWGYIVDGRPEEALAEYAQLWDHCLPCEVVALVRTGRMDKATSLVDGIRRNTPFITVSRESTWPTGHQPFMAEPYLSAYLGDLRKAGLPET
jgi:tetratricopeptide (TPR) repeat protein